MTLVYVGIAFGILALIVEMTVDYRRRAAEVAAEMEELGRQIAAHARKAQAARLQLAAALERAAGLKREKSGLEADLNARQQLLAETEEEERRNPARFLVRTPTDLNGA